LNGPVFTSAAPAPVFEAGVMRLTWSASPLDDGPAGRIGTYRVWRDRLSRTLDGDPGPTVAGVGARPRPVAGGVSRDARGPVAAVAAAEPEAFEIPTDPEGGGAIHDWELVGTLPADGSTEYVLDVSLPPSPPASPGVGLFFVEAVDAEDPELVWRSEIIEAAAAVTPSPGRGPLASGHASFELGLGVPRPNPASATARLRFALARGGPVEIGIHGVDGRRVRTLVRADYGAGTHEAVWDRRGDDGRPVPGGLYFIRLDAEGRRFVRRLSVVP
jgi:hypothetical protein